MIRFFFLMVPFQGTFLHFHGGQATTRSWVSNSTSLWVADTVDGRNPAPPWMYKTLEIMQWTRINYLWTGAGFLPSTVSQHHLGEMGSSARSLWWIIGCEVEFDNMSKSKERVRTHVSLPEDVLPCFNHLFFNSHHNYLQKKSSIPSVFSSTFWHDKTQKRKEHSANQKTTCLIRFISLTKRFQVNRVVPPPWTNHVFFRWLRLLKMWLETCQSVHRFLKMLQGVTVDTPGAFKIKIVLQKHSKRSTHAECRNSNHTLYKYV